MIISREEAKNKGFKRYFEGFMCLRGHLSERKISSNNCIECIKEKARVLYKKDTKNPIKQFAKNNNLKTYMVSRPCNKCGNYIRYTSSMACPTCSYKWRLDNPEKTKEATKRYNKKHPDVTRMRSKNGKKRIKRNTPKWIDREERAKIKSFYDLARYFTFILDEEFHVDHIIPLQGKLVSGLHVSNNLQILPAKENIVKNNKFMEI